MKTVEVDHNSCIKCGACVKDCIVEVLKFDANGFPAVAPNDEPFCLNCQHCLAICPQGAISCHGVSASACSPISKLPDEAEMLNLLKQRRSIRQYKDENIEPAIMEKLKNSLAWTPTGCNHHQLCFTIIEDKTEMSFFRQEMSKMLKMLIKTGIMRLIYPNFKRYLAEIMADKDVVFRDAPHMLVAFTPKKAPCAYADPWIALSYFDLYAQSLNLGSWWCGFALHAFKWNRKLRDRLNIPKGYKIGAVILFGKPAVSYPRATAPNQFKINVR